jgi:hypothetical protein
MLDSPDRQTAFTCSSNAFRSVRGRLRVISFFIQIAKVDLRSFADKYRNLVQLRMHGDRLPTLIKLCRAPCVAVHWLKGSREKKRKKQRKKLDGIVS